MLVGMPLLRLLALGTVLWLAACGSPRLPRFADPPPVDSGVSDAGR
jgi:hypothetical protein